MKQEEMNEKFRLFEKEIIQIQQQLEVLENAILEMSRMNLGLDDLVGKKDEEIFAPLGKGIYARAKLLSEDLLVNVGDGNFITKSIPETKKMIISQIEKLNEIRDSLENELDKINEEITKVMNETEK